MSDKIQATAVVTDGIATIHSAGSPAGDIARALLAAADDPSQVRTVTTTTGIGWQVPEAVAKTAGLIAEPAEKRGKRVTSSS